MILAAQQIAVENTEGTKCALCQEAKPIVFFQIPRYPLPQQAADSAQLRNIPKTRLEVAFCNKCGHIMLVNPPDPHVMETVYTQFFVTCPSVGTTGIGSLRTKRFLNFVSDH